MLLPLQDGGILTIFTDREMESGGCDTCDYGDNYINYFKITMTSGSIEVKVDNTCDYAFSEGYIMQIILPNVDQIKMMTEESFFYWLQENIKPAYAEQVDQLEIKFI